MTTKQVTRREDALEYLNERTGTLEYRFQRYAAVADELYARGLDDSCIIADLGAGMGDFAFYLRAVRGYKGRYLPIDAAIDGTDLELGWAPKVEFDFVVSIELIEHIEFPEHLIRDMRMHATRAVVITTPNTDVLGAEYVQAMDRTHVSPIYERDLRIWGADKIVEGSFFGKRDDSYVGVWYCG